MQRFLISFARFIRRVAEFLWTGTGIILFALLLMGIVLSGCTRKIYIPVHSMEQDSVSSYRHRADTFETHDTIMFIQRGDTIVKERISTRMRTRVRVDTLIKISHDTVTRLLPADVTSQKKSSGKRPLSERLKSFFQWLGVYFTLATAGFFIGRYLCRRMGRCG